MLAISYYAIASMEFGSLKDLIERARTRPGQLTIGFSGGTRTAVLETLSKQSNTRFATVSYPGPKFIAAIVAGQVNCAILPLGQTVSLGNQARTLAVFSEKRISRFADLPTAIEQGVKQVAFVSYGLMLPKGTDKAILARLQDAALAAARSTKFSDLVSREGLIANSEDSEAFAAYLATGRLFNTAIPNSNDCSQCSCKNKDEACYKDCCDKS
jgi:tripartite-type tricarboxylate transporter receptor subunit TctC